MNLISIEFHYLPDLFGPPHQRPEWHRYKVYYLNVFSWKLSIWKTKTLY